MCLDQSSDYLRPVFVRRHLLKTSNPNCCPLRRSKKSLCITRPYCWPGSAAIVCSKWLTWTLMHSSPLKSCCSKSAVSVSLLLCLAMKRAFVWDDECRSFGTCPLWKVAAVSPQSISLFLCYALCWELQLCGGMHHVWRACNISTISRLGSRKCSEMSNCTDLILRWPCNHKK